MIEPHTNMCPIPSLEVSSPLGHSPAASLPNNYTDALPPPSPAHAAAVSEKNSGAPSTRFGLSILLPGTEVGYTKQMPVILSSSSNPPPSSSPDLDLEPISPLSPDYRDAILFKAESGPLAPLPPIAKKRTLPGTLGAAPGATGNAVHRGRRASAPAAVSQSLSFRLASKTLAKDTRDMSLSLPFPPPPGHGTLEEVELLQALRHCPPQTTAFETGSSSVLLVDPYRAHHEYLKLLLGPHGVSLDSGVTGLEALSLMQNKVYR